MLISTQLSDRNSSSNLLFWWVLSTSEIVLNETYIYLSDYILPLKIEWKILNHQGRVDFDTLKLNNFSNQLTDSKKFVIFCNLKTKRAITVFYFVLYTAQYSWLCFCIFITMLRFKSWKLLSILFLFTWNSLLKITALLKKKTSLQPQLFAVE